jgi:hypothetical protein
MVSLGACARRSISATRPSCPAVHLAGRTGSLGHRPDAGLTHCTGGGISGYDHAVCTIHILTAT